MGGILLMALLVVAGVPAIQVGYVILAERLLQRLPEKRQWALRPWLWLAPALCLIAIFLVYPAVNTLYLSVMGPPSDRFVGLQNYIFTFTNREMLIAFRNNLLFLGVSGSRAQLVPGGLRPLADAGEWTRKRSSRPRRSLENASAW